MSSESFSPIRKVRCFIPPPDAPLLTVYNRSLLPKLAPMKQRFKIFSSRIQSPGRQSHPETVILRSSQVDIVNNLYRKIKRSRGQPVHQRQTSFVKDPLYRSIYNLKKQSLKLSSRRSSSVLCQSSSVQ